MGKRIWLMVVILVLTLSTGCDLNILGSTQPTSEGPSLDELSTLSAMGTVFAVTPTLEIPDLLAATATPNLDAAGQGGEVPTESNTLRPTNTSLPGTIKILSITQRVPGVAMITWEATGEFPSGFKVVFTDQQKPPTYPDDKFATVSTSSARSAVINYTADRIYYVRVCRFMISGCDIYSDLGIFAFAPPTATPKPTKTSSGSGSTGGIIKTGTIVPSDPTLVITIVKGGTDGKAYMAWTDKSSSPKGYKIVYSTSNPDPSLEKDSYFYVPDSAARSAYVDGASNTKYYYRLCRYTGSACSSYSAVYTFTFPTYSIVSTPTKTSTADSSTITISTITNTATGVAQVNWTASGTFPNGFKILYSKTTALPTLSDSVTVISDGAALFGSINGDPSTLYHVRVCKYSGSECTIYSPVVDFTFSADPISITLISAVDGTTPGDIDLTWSISGGTTPNGFILLLSSNSTPDTSNSTQFTASNGNTTATISGDPSTAYYVRICKSLGSTCGPYSNTLSITTAAVP